MDTRRGRGPGTKGAALSLRIPAHLRAQIDEKVKETGTNTSHVVETLLMEALGERRHTEGLLREAAELKYGPDLARILLAIGEVMDHIGKDAFFTKEGIDSKGDWHTEPWAFDQAVKAAQLVLDHARPNGEIVDPPPVEDEERASKFWKMSHRYFLDFPPLDDLRRALAGEPGRGDPYMFFGFHQRIAADLNDDSYGSDEE